MTAVVVLLFVGVIASSPAPVHAAPPISRTVSSTADTGGSCPTSTTCTLRQAIADSNANDPGAGNQNAITFAAGVTGMITLTNDAQHGTLTLAQRATITGPMSGAGVAVDGGCMGCDPGGTPVGGVTVFTINSGVTASISNLTVQHGNGAPIGNGGGISNQGSLTLTTVILSGNATPGYGVGVRNDGTLTTAIGPISGPVTGGTTITITGVGFVNVTGVTVGGVACTAVTPNGAGTSMTCVTGAHAAGTVDVKITTTTSSYTAVGFFTYGIAANAPTGGRPSTGGPGNPNPAPPGSGGPAQPGTTNPAPPARPVVP